MSERPGSDNGPEDGGEPRRIDESLRQVEDLLRSGEPVEERPKLDPDLVTGTEEEEHEQLIARQEAAKRRVLDEATPRPDDVDRRVLDEANPPLPDETDEGI